MLTNAGEERLRGVDLSIGWSITPNLQWRGAWSFHDAEFRDFVTDFGGVATQLEGNRVEMSARTMGATGLFYARDHGWIGSGQVNIVGNRYLNKRNTALAPAYATWSGGVGYRAAAWEYRLDVTNLTDQRPPVAESELGDAQYYRLPALRVVGGVSYRFPAAGAAPVSSSTS
jgi:outer membrane receptor protein involved in Fe transport